MSDVKVFRNTVHTGRNSGVNFIDSPGLDIEAARSESNDRVDLRFTSSDSILNASDGLLGTNFSKFQIDTAVALTSGTTKFTALPIRKGQVVTKLWFLVTVAAASVTTIKAGLYDSAGNRLAASANATTAFDTDDAYASVTLSTPYTVTADAVLLAAVLSVAGTAGSLGGTAAVAGKGTAIGTGTVISGTEGSQTDLDATATITTATNPLWVGWS